MSKIGKIPVQLPKEIKANITVSQVGLEGPKGKLQISLPAGIKVENKDGQLLVTRSSDAKQDRANHGKSAGGITGDRRASAVEFAAAL